MLLPRYINCRDVARLNVSTRCIAETIDFLAMDETRIYANPLNPLLDTKTATVARITLVDNFEIDEPLRIGIKSFE